MIITFSSSSSLVAQWLSLKWLAAATVLVTGCYLLSIGVYSYCFSPLRKIPGPFLARFTRLWEISTVSTGHQDDLLIKLHAKYGPIVRISPNKYSLNDPADAKVIYAPNSGFSKTPYYNALGDPTRHSIFNMQNEKAHAEQKRKIGGLYTVSTLVHYEPSVDLMCEILLSKLEQFAQQSRLVAVHDMMQYFAFDLIAQITLDKNFGMTQSQADYKGAIASIHRLQKLGSRIAVVPEVLGIIVRLGKLIKTKHPGLAVGDFARDQVAAARRENKLNHVTSDMKAQPFVYKCLELEAEGKLVNNDILNACTANLAAGSDTTGITLSTVFYHLYRDPDSLQKLRSELDSAAAEGRLSNPTTFQEAQALPYLLAVVKEALRLHPAVPVMLPRYVKQGGAHLGGYFLPAGTEVGVSARALHLNKTYHGQDCTEWKPERWLDPSLRGDPDRKAAMSFSFGGGSRVCMGRNISLLEIYKLVPEVVRRYDLVFETNEIGQVVEPEVHTMFFSWLKYKCYVKKRALSQNEKTVTQT